MKHLDADIVQLDEANLPGHPEEWEWAASAINRVLDAVKTTPAVHLCFGNYGGQSVQSGTWEQLIRYLNALHADHVVLECAHRPPEELAVFKGLKPEIGFGLGVVDIKATEIESADAVARAIERAEQLLGRGPGPLHPPGLRLLDAEAPDRRRQDPRARARPRPLRGPQPLKGRPGRPTRRRTCPTGIRAIPHPAGASAPTPGPRGGGKNVFCTLARGRAWTTPRSTSSKTARSFART